MTVPSCHLGIVWPTSYENRQNVPPDLGGGYSQPWMEFGDLAGCTSTRTTDAGFTHIKDKAQFPRTSLAALTLNTPYAMASIPPNTIAVLLFQFAGLVHHPPCEMSFEQRYQRRYNAHLMGSRLVLGRDICHLHPRNIYVRERRELEEVRAPLLSLKVKIETQPLMANFGADRLGVGSRSCQ